jgi:hypothetical protein
MPGGDAADQPAAAGGHQQVRQLRRVLLEFQRHGALAGQHLRLVVGVHHQGAGRGGAGLAGGARLVIGGAAHHQPGAVALDAGALGRAGQLRHEDLGRHAERPRRMGHRRAVVAARGGDHACARRRHGEHAVEGAARLEAAGGLKQLQLQHRIRAQAKIGAGEPQQRRPPDMWGDACGGRADGGPGDGKGQAHADGTGMPHPAPQLLVAWNLPPSLPFLAVCSVAAAMLLHASAAARGADAVLFLGPPGAGKSDLVLRLIGQGWHLVADDQTRLLPAGDGTLRAEAPEALRGMLEVRGLGIFTGLPVAEPPPRLRLAVHLAADRAAIPRLPAPATWDAGAGLALPAVTLHAFDASAPAKVGLALDAATGRARQRAGAFA